MDETLGFRRRHHDLGDDTLMLDSAVGFYQPISFTFIKLPRSSVTMTYFLPVCC